jgi:hypothetical protein
MDSHDRYCEQDTMSEGIRQIASLAAAVRVMCIANELRLSEQSFTVTRQPQPPVAIDFTERAPFGFAFTEGRDATFHVPTGYRYVIENVYVSCWAKHDRVDLHLVTRSRRMFRQVTLRCWPEPAMLDARNQNELAAPILVNESTSNAFLFSDAEVHNSSTVPPETYVQIWGYLEPVHEAEVM